jgi:addiction module HigA family antidote
MSEEMNCIMARLDNVHPGEVLREEFLNPLGITPYRLAKSVGVQQTRIEHILDGKRGVSVDTAIRLGRFFHVSAQFWLNLQLMYDLEEIERDPEHHEEYDRIRAYDEQPVLA